MRLRPEHLKHAFAKAGVGVLGLAVTAALGLAAAPSASAANALPATVYLDGGGAGSCASPSIVDGGLAPVTGITADAGDILTINRSGSSNCYQVTAVWLDSTSSSVGAATNVTGASSAPAVPVGAVSVEFSYKVNSGSSLVTVGAPIPITARSGGGGGGSSSATGGGSVAPVLVELSVGGTTCDEAATTGYVGAWVQVPTTCAKPVGVPAGAVLLGWATTPTFPVAIAQRQADNTWGTYEVLDADGRVSAVFIPAGWGAFVSGSNTLYPIWSK